MREHLPFHLSYMAASMILIMIQYVESDLAIGSMFGGETHWWVVSLGKISPNSFCSTCFHGSMSYCMATMLDHLPLCGVSHNFVAKIPLICIGEGFFYGFPSWEVIHFIWMIAWRWESFMNHEIPHDFHHFYLEEAMDQ